MQYCRHATTADVLAAEINATDPTDKRYARLLVMAARESKALAMLSAKLRLAPQHVRRVEHLASTPRPGLVPWQKHV